MARLARRQPGLTVELVRHPKDGVPVSDRVNRRTILPAPVEEAWAALTDPDALSAWFGAAVELEATPLGSGRFEFPDGRVRRAVVEEVVEGERLTFRWWPEDDRGDATRVEIVLTPADDDTGIEVVEQPLARARAYAAA